MNYNRASGRYGEEGKKLSFAQVEIIEARLIFRGRRSAVLH